VSRLRHVLVVTLVLALVGGSSLALRPAPASAGIPPFSEGLTVTLNGQTVGPITVREGDTLTWTVSFNDGEPTAYFGIVGVGGVDSPIGEAVGGFRRGTDVIPVPDLPPVEEGVLSGSFVATASIVAAIRSGGDFFGASLALVDGTGTAYYTSNTIDLVTPAIPGVRDPRSPRPGAFTVRVTPTPTVVPRSPRPNSSPVVLPDAPESPRPERSPRPARAA
jgi:hypothetical protein